MNRSYYVLSVDIEREREGRERERGSRERGRGERGRKGRMEEGSTCTQFVDN